MSQNNAEIVKRMYTAFAERDLMTIVSICDPGIEVRQTEEIPWGGTFTGLAGMQAFFAKLTGLIDSRVEAEEYLEAGDRVAVIGWTRGTVKASQNPFDIRIVHIWTLSNGRAVRFEPYIDTPGMLGALNGDQND